jgi:regulator of protease activity HflC (stomatin/prohibitin superfamily)
LLVKIDISVFYRIIGPGKTLYNIRKADSVISNTFLGVMRAKTGKIELD